MILSRGGKAVGAITTNVVFTFPNRGWLKRCLNAFLRGAMVRKKKRWADPYYLVTIIALSRIRAPLVVL